MAAAAGTWILLPLLCAAATAASGKWAADYDPKPNPESVVTVGGQARFTVLTERLIRMEWGGTNDAATFSFVNRNLPTPQFSVSKEDDRVVIQTPFLKIQYLPNNTTFSADNLQVSLRLDTETVTWTPQTAANTSLDGNLLGTIRTLDGVNGSADLNCYTQTRADLHCQLGLVSQRGYVVVDDSHHPQFDTSQWPWVVNASYPPPSRESCAAVPMAQRRACGYLGIDSFNCINIGCCYDTSGSKGAVGREGGLERCYYGNTSYNDLYFFGHARAYEDALTEFVMIAGRIPLPPRYAFGVFYSRYWAYNDIGEEDIVLGYKSRNIPLDVVVTDMDWHITFYKEASEGVRDQAGQVIGWTGFTWDKHLFPNPKSFLAWCQSNGLRNTLNIHPASGIQPWEDTYAQMATAMGIDPQTQKYVPFVPSDPKFVQNWLQIVMAAREHEGIDFWWLDWQQGEDWIKIPLVNPTFWLNYIFFTTPYHWRNNTVRPFLLHRWGGLGNHRYQVGFSGDVMPSWASLHFQVNFTLCATNVGFGYWSHDLGGHLDPTPPELYTRWIQWGTFSPMFRTHCTKNPKNMRRIWVYPPENYKIMRNFMVLRASLVPYIYTHARYAYDRGLSLLRPLYYPFPESPEAYTYENQYMFGPNLLVAPVTQPVDATTQLVTKEIWIPKGNYISWFSGEMISGPQVIKRTFTLWEMPVFAVEGSIIPMRTDDFAPLGSAAEIPSKLKFLLFIGECNYADYSLYEDDGNTTDYMTGNTATTLISFSVDRIEHVVGVTIGATQGKVPGLPLARQYQIQIPGFSPADKVMLAGSSLPYVSLQTSFSEYKANSWTYDGSSLSLLVNIVTPQSITSSLSITISYASYANFDPYFSPGFAGRLARFQAAKQTLDMQWGTDTVYQEEYFALLNATEIGSKISSSPSSAPSLLSAFPSYVSKAINEVLNLKKLNETIKLRVVAQISEL